MTPIAISKLRYFRKYQRKTAEVHLIIGTTLIDVITRYFEDCEHEWHPSLPK